MKMTDSLLLILACALTGLLLPACNTDYHFLYTPHLDRDFYESPEEMERLWFDINRYREVTFPFTAFFEMPSLKELKYGNYFIGPVERRWSWWNLCPFFAVIPLCPCERMIWEWGNYRFDAVIAYPMVFWYSPHLWYWEVEELERPEADPGSFEQEASYIQETEVTPETEVPDEGDLPPETDASEEADLLPETEGVEEADLPWETDVPDDIDLPSEKAVPDEADDLPPETEKSPEREVSPDSGKP